MATCKSELAADNPAIDLTYLNSWADVEVPWDYLDEDGNEEVESFPVSHFTTTERNEGY